MAEFFKAESVVWAYNIYKDVWSAAVGTTLCTLSTRKVPSLRGRSGQVLATCQTVDNTPYSSMHLATLAFSSKENCSYVPRVTVLLSIIVSTIGFISSLITSIREDSMVCVKDPFEPGKIASLLPRLRIIFFHVFVNLKYLNSIILLMPKVNILRVKFS